jgi:hypothetical protein
MQLLSGAIALLLQKSIPMAGDSYSPIQAKQGGKKEGFFRK